MDRDHRWDRTRRAYDAIVTGIRRACRFEPLRRFEAATTPASPMSSSSRPSSAILGPAGMQEGECHLLQFPFRPRPPNHHRTRTYVRRISPARRSWPEPDRADHMTRYEAGCRSRYFRAARVVNPLAKVISDAGLAQFHCAETEKYPHVTFFFNGGREEPFPGEERTLIPSPRWRPTTCSRR